MFCLFDAIISGENTNVVPPSELGDRETPTSEGWLVTTQLCKHPAED
ncbi:hypothetical protein AG1IA_08113 [Rhizoctonia solani AG-1 IA]|uniref:Uncharacterized protein n=1 Tax=Thanatephorus cucumeris (strain AG1-IA) TaxID=983506 RepID=L8WM84_THACA|nr:hypothetical protein AG1IA_08113 [Rhizoctonia solani AG-1 IA]